MKMFILAAATAALTTFAPMSAKAQIAVEVPGVGVRIGEPPRYDGREERREFREERRERPEGREERREERREFRERDVRGTRDRD